MRTFSLRNLPFAALALACVLASPLFAVSPPAALAQAGGTGGSSSGNTNNITETDFLMRLLRINGDGDWTIFTDFDKRTYFNRARCECAETIRLEVDLTNTGAAKRSQFTTSQANIEVLIGPPECVAKEPQVRQAVTCQPLGVLKLADLARTRQRPAFDFVVSKLYGREGNSCLTRGQQTIWLRIDIDGNGTPDLVDDAAPSLPVEYDGEAPNPPGDIRVEPGNEALEVSWETNQGVADFRGFVVLCSRGEDLQVYEPDYYDDQYRTAATVCGRQTTIDQAQVVFSPSELASALLSPTFATTDGGATDGGGQPTQAKGPFVPPTHFANLDRRFVCSDLLRTQTSTRLKGLQNGIPYLVGVATVDAHFNPSPIRGVYLQQPVATRDFFEGYQAAGGTAEGGYCALARGRAGRGLEALGVLALTALGLRRLARRRPRS